MPNKIMYSTKKPGDADDSELCCATVPQGSRKRSTLRSNKEKINSDMREIRSLLPAGLLKKRTKKTRHDQLQATVQFIRSLMRENEALVEERNKAFSVLKYDVSTGNPLTDAANNLDSISTNIYPSTSVQTVPCCKTLTNYFDYGKRVEDKQCSGTEDRRQQGGEDMQQPSMMFTETLNRVYQPVGRPRSSSSVNQQQFGSCGTSVNVSDSLLSEVYNVKANKSALYNGIGVPSWPHAPENQTMYNKPSGSVQHFSKFFSIPDQFSCTDAAPNYSGINAFSIANGKTSQQIEQFCNPTSFQQQPVTYTSPSHANNFVNVQSNAPIIPFASYGVCSVTRSITESIPISSKMTRFKASDRVPCGLSTKWYGLDRSHCTARELTSDIGKSCDDMSAFVKESYSRFSQFHREREAIGNNADYDIYGTNASFDEGSNYVSKYVINNGNSDSLFSPVCLNESMIKPEYCFPRADEMYSNVPFNVCVSNVSFTSSLNQTVTPDSRGWPLWTMNSLQDWRNPYAIMFASDNISSVTTSLPTNLCPTRNSVSINNKFVEPPVGHLDERLSTDAMLELPCTTDKCILPIKPISRSKKKRTYSSQSLTKKQTLRPLLPKPSFHLPATCGDCSTNLSYFSSSTRDTDFLGHGVYGTDSLHMQTSTTGSTSIHGSIMSSQYYESHTDSVNIKNGYSTLNIVANNYHPNTFTTLLASIANDSFSYVEGLQPSNGFSAVHVPISQVSFSPSYSSVPALSSSVFTNVPKSLYETSSASDQNVNASISLKSHCSQPCNHSSLALTFVSCYTTQVPIMTPAICDYYSSFESITFPYNDRQFSSTNLPNENVLAANLEMNATPMNSAPVSHGINPVSFAAVCNELTSLCQEDVESLSSDVIPTSSDALDIVQSLSLSMNCPTTTVSSSFVDILALAYESIFAPDEPNAEVDDTDFTSEKGETSFLTNGEEFAENIFVNESCKTNISDTSVTNFDIGLNCTVPSCISTIQVTSNVKQLNGDAVVAAKNSNRNVFSDIFLVNSTAMGMDKCVPDSIVNPIKSKDYYKRGDIPVFKNLGKVLSDDGLLTVTLNVKEDAIVKNSKCCRRKKLIKKKSITGNGTLLQKNIEFNLKSVQKMQKRKFGSRFVRKSMLGNQFGILYKNDNNKARTSFPPAAKVFNESGNFVTENEHFLVFGSDATLNSDISFRSDQSIVMKDKLPMNVTESSALLQNEALQKLLLSAVQCEDSLSILNDISCEGLDQASSMSALINLCDASPVVSNFTSQESNSAICNGGETLKLACSLLKINPDHGQSIQANISENMSETNLCTVPTSLLDNALRRMSKYFATNLFDYAPQVINNVNSIVSCTVLTRVSSSSTFSRSNSAPMLSVVSDNGRLSEVGKACVSISDVGSLMINNEIITVSSTENSLSGVYQNNENENLFTGVASNVIETFRNINSATTPVNERIKKRCIQSINIVDENMESNKFFEFVSGKDKPFEELFERKFPRPKRQLRLPKHLENMHLYESKYVWDGSYVYRTYSADVSNNGSESNKLEYICPSSPELMELCCISDREDHLVEPLPKKVKSDHTLLKHSKKASKKCAKVNGLFRNVAKTVERDFVLKPIDECVLLQDDSKNLSTTSNVTIEERRLCGEFDDELRLTASSDTFSEISEEDSVWHSSKKNIPDASSQVKISFSKNSHRDVIDSTAVKLKSIHDDGTKAKNKITLPLLLKRFQHGPRKAQLLHQLSYPPIVCVSRIQNPVYRRKVKVPLCLSKFKNPACLNKVKNPVCLSKVKNPVFPSKDNNPVSPSNVKNPACLNKVKNPLRSEIIADKLYADFVESINCLAQSKHSTTQKWGKMKVCDGESNQKCLQLKRKRGRPKKINLEDLSHNNIIESQELKERLIHERVTKVALKSPAGNSLNRVEMGKTILTTDSSRVSSLNSAVGCVFQTAIARTKGASVVKKKASTEINKPLIKRKKSGKAEGVNKLKTQGSGFKRGIQWDKLRKNLISSAVGVEMNVEKFKSIDSEVRTTTGLVYGKVKRVSPSPSNSSQESLSPQKEVITVLFPESEIIKIMSPEKEVIKIISPEKDVIKIMSPEKGIIKIKCSIHSLTKQQKIPSNKKSSDARTACKSKSFSSDDAALASEFLAQDTSDLFDMVRALDCVDELVAFSNIGFSNMPDILSCNLPQESNLFDYPTTSSDNTPYVETVSREAVQTTADESLQATNTDPSSSTGSENKSKALENHPEISTIFGAMNASNFVDNNLLVDIANASMDASKMYNVLQTSNACQTLFSNNDDNNNNVYSWSCSSNFASQTNSLELQLKSNTEVNDFNRSLNTLGLNIPDTSANLRSSDVHDQSIYSRKRLDIFSEQRIGTAPMSCSIDYPSVCSISYNQPSTYPGSNQRIDAMIKYPDDYRPTLFSSDKNLDAVITCSIRYPLSLYPSHQDFDTMTTCPNGFLPSIYNTNLANKTYHQPSLYSSYKGFETVTTCTTRYPLSLYTSHQGFETITTCPTGYTPTIYNTNLANKIDYQPSLYSSDNGFESMTTGTARYPLCLYTSQQGFETMTTCPTGYTPTTYTSNLKTDTMSTYPIVQQFYNQLNFNNLGFYQNSFHPVSRLPMQQFSDIPPSPLSRSNCSTSVDYGRADLFKSSENKKAKLRRRHGNSLSFISKLNVLDSSMCRTIPRQVHPSQRMEKRLSRQYMPGDGICVSNKSNTTSRVNCVDQSTYYNPVENTQMSVNWNGRYYPIVSLCSGRCACIYPTDGARSAIAPFAECRNVSLPIPGVQDNSYSREIKCNLRTNGLTCTRGYTMNAPSYWSTNPIQERNRSPSNVTLSPIGYDFSEKTNLSRVNSISASFLHDWHSTTNTTNSESNWKNYSMTDQSNYSSNSLLYQMRYRSRSRTNPHNFNRNNCFSDAMSFGAASFLNGSTTFDACNASTSVINRDQLFSFPRRNYNNLETVVQEGRASFHDGEYYYYPWNILGLDLNAANVLRNPYVQERLNTAQAPINFSTFRTAPALRSLYVQERSNTIPTAIDFNTYQSAPAGQVLPGGIAAANMRRVENNRFVTSGNYQGFQGYGAYPGTY